MEDDSSIDQINSIKNYISNSNYSRCTLLYSINYISSINRYDILNRLEKIYPSETKLTVRSIHKILKTLIQILDDYAN